MRALVSVKFLHFQVHCLRQNRSLLPTSQVPVRFETELSVTIGGREKASKSGVTDVGSSMRTVGPSS